MYGAILGDIIGSRFEFDRGPWTKDFELVTNECGWTDDSVMTIAVAEGLMNAGKDATVETIRKECITSMKKWGQKYPHAGYGARFIHWVLTDEPTPYNSLGNGSAMRVSAAGWLYDSLERTREVARATSEVSHNHPEGIKGAECTAAVMFLARTGATKDEIKEYVVGEFGYDISKTVDELRPFHHHEETCMDALPKALVSFFEGESYEDVVRNAVSLGGDTDTIAAIAGAMAEAFYGMPVVLLAECIERVEEDMKAVIMRFNRILGRAGFRDNEQDETDNDKLNAVYHQFVSEKNEDERAKKFINFLDFLTMSIADNALTPTPYVDVNNAMMKNLDFENVKLGETIRQQEEVRLRIDKMTDGNGKFWLPLFFTREELYKGDTTNVIMPTLVYDILQFGYNWEDVEGVVINPFGQPFTLNKDLLGIILKAYKEWAEKNGIELPQGPGVGMK